MSLFRSISKSDIKRLSDKIWDQIYLPMEYKLELGGMLKNMYVNYDKISDSVMREAMTWIKSRLEWIKTHDPYVIISQLIFDLIDIILKPISLSFWILRHIKEVVLFVVVAALIAGGTYYGIKLRKVIKK